MVCNDYNMKDIRIGYVSSDETLEVQKLINENFRQECMIDYLFCDSEEDYYSISVDIKY